MKFEDYVDTKERLAKMEAELALKEAELAKIRANIEREQYDLSHNWQNCEQLQIVPVFRSVEFYKGPDLSKEVVEVRKGGKKCYLESYQVRIVDAALIDNGFIYLGEARPSQYGELSETVAKLIAKGVYHAWPYHTLLAANGNGQNGQNGQMDLPLPASDLLKMYKTIVGARNTLEAGKISDHTRGQLAEEITNVLPLIGRYVGRLGFAKEGKKV